jgi:tetratricopeptide (TPR) repeat protein
MDMRFLLPFVAAPLGSAYLWSGRAADAAPLLEEAVEAITAMRMLSFRPWFITFLAEAYLVLGRVAEAREQAQQAIALARAQQHRSREAWGLKLLGDVRAHEPTEFEQVGEAYREALALATELGMRPLVAHCHFGLGKLDRQTNKREQAREHLTTATTMYREMGMQFWLEQAEVEIKELV